MAPWQKGQGDCPEVVSEHSNRSVPTLPEGHLRASATLRIDQLAHPTAERPPRDGSQGSDNRCDQE